MLRFPSAVSLSAVLAIGLSLGVLHGFAIAADEPLGTLCAKPAGLVERDVTFDETGSGRSFAGRLAGPNKTFLYMRRTSRAAQTRAALAPLAYASVLLGDKPFGENTPDAAHMTSRQYIEIEKRVEGTPELASSLKVFESSFEHAQPEPNWYFYSNSPRFAEYFRNENLELPDPDRGALLLMNAKGEKLGLAKFTEKMVNSLGADVVIIEGDGGSEIDPAHITTHPGVLRITDGATSEPFERAMDTNRLLQNAAADNTTFLFLMPETVDEAKVWGFSPDLAEAYAVNGGRILHDLEHYGLTKQIRKIKDRASLSAAVSSGPNDHLFVLIGESSDGENVRVPGSTETVTPKDFASIQAGKSFVGLVCNSQVLLKDVPGLSVVGTIYTDTLRSVARILFDKREGDSISEYIQGAKSSEGNSVRDALFTSAAHLSPSGGSVVTQRPTLFVAQSVPGTIGLFSPASTSPGGQEGSGGIAQSGSGGGGIPGDDPPVPLLWIALSGVAGGLGRELMRWKSLTDRKRADLFRKPQYFAISAVQLGLAACVAMIFTQVISGHWKYPVAFVSGAGLEELVRLAMKLKVWTPAVPHGPGERKDTIVEFLRA